MYKEMYTKCFNAITDLIEGKKDEIEKLSKLQQELEDMYVDFDALEASSAEEIN